MRQNKNKASQKFDIPTKITKDSADIFAEYLRKTVNNAIKIYNFSNSLKLLDITPSHKGDRKDKRTKKAIDQQAFYRHYQKYLKKSFLSKCQVSLIIFYQNNNLALEKDIAHNIVI